ncbi:hypothetical protein GGF42_001420 [Coemansia sp. RSA 2424]|nr:hypothetical protein GGF42_001420 [Coemansia sp. RSA 2424]
MEVECADQQQCEMEALAAIYATAAVTDDNDDDNKAFAYTTDSDGLVCGSVAVDVDASVCEALISSAARTDATSGDAIDWGKLKYLPPIQLRFTLPVTYPLVDAPRISLSCSWLSAETLEAVQCWMDEVWLVERGMCVLDSYINRLRYDLVSSATSIRIVLTSATEHEVTAYNARRQREAFEMQTYTCMICLEPQSGKHCVELSCSHVHCTQCLRGYWAMLIDEGSVWLVQCPHPTCRSPAASDSRRSLVTSSELSHVLSVEQVERYTVLSEQRRVDMDSSRYAWCPREGCGQWGPRDTKQDKLCICSACGFAFCVCCRRVWHGTSFCAIGSRLRVIEEYRLALDADPKAVAALEKRYGRSVLERMLEEQEAEEETERAVSAMAQACPTCGVRIVKAYGCNHICCTQCNTHFCYLCGSFVEKSDPLAHFRSINSTCYMMLLEGVLGDNDQPTEAGIEMDF